MRMERAIAPIALGIGFSAAGILPLQADPIAKDKSNAVIQSFCMAAFKSEFARAGKTPPKGMGAFTCDCLGQRMLSGEDLSTARETCTMEANRRFPLPKG